jgi:SHS2 domain-containing protein
MGEGHWELTSHGSDIGVCGYGRTMDEAFEQAATALTAIVTDPESVRSLRQVSLACEAPDQELLLAEWLNALIYEMSTERMLFGGFDVSINGHNLAATAWGEPVDVARHQPAVEPKGATYTGLRVFEEPSGRWCAQCVVDV